MSNNGACKHLNFIIREGDMMGRCHCPDCEENPWLSDCFNNLAERMREVLKKPSED